MSFPSSGPLPRSHHTPLLLPPPLPCRGSYCKRQGPSCRQAQSQVVCVPCAPSMVPPGPPRSFQILPAPTQYPPLPTPTGAPSCSGGRSRPAGGLGLPLDEDSLGHPRGRAPYCHWAKTLRGHCPSSAQSLAFPRLLAAPRRPQLGRLHASHGPLYLPLTRGLPQPHLGRPVHCLPPLGC